MFKYAWTLHLFRFLLGLIHAIYLEAWKCVYVYKYVLWFQMNGANINSESLFLARIFLLLLLISLLLELIIC